MANIFPDGLKWIATGLVLTQGQEVARGEERITDRKLKYLTTQQCEIF
jgi:hypothetical protein